MTHIKLSITDIIPFPTVHGWYLVNPSLESDKWIPMMVNIPNEFFAGLDGKTVHFDQIGGWIEPPTVCRPTKMLDKLQEYLKFTSPEQKEADWKAIQIMKLNGPSVDEFLSWK